MTKISGIKVVTATPETTQKNLGGYSEAMIETMRKIGEDQNPRTSVIMGKLISGRALTTWDLNYLQNTSERLYNTASTVTRDRKCFNTSLKRCRSKSEVLAAKTSKIGSLAAMRNRIKTCDEAGEVSLRMAAINDEYIQYTRNDKYKKLPEKRTLKKHRRLVDRRI